MSRPRPTERRRVVSANLREVYDRCPFRSVLGIAPPSQDGALDDLLPRIAHAIAVFGGDPEPIGAETMLELVATIRAGGAVLLMSDRADLRNHARREILAMVDLQDGGAHPVTANRRAVH